MSVYGIYYVPSSRIPGLKYKVLVGPTGAACSCPWGVNNRSREKPCRHINTILKEFEVTTAVALRVDRPVARIPTKAEIESMDFIAANLADKGLIAVPAALRGEENAGVRRAIIFAGYELGVRPMTALRHMIPVEGTIEPDGQLMASICQGREPSIVYETIEDTAEAVTVRLRRPSKGIVAEYRCTQADIDRAGLQNKDNHKKWPRQMKRWQCYKNLSRAYCGDLINGVEMAPMAGPLTDEEPETPIAGIVEGEVIRPGSLYNDGDTEEDGETAPSIEEQQAAVEVLTKAVKEKAAEPAKPTATREQLASLRDWTEQLQQKAGDKPKADAAIESFNVWLRKSFPYAITGDRFQIQNVYEADMARVIAAMKQFVETAALPADEEAHFE